MNKLIFIIGMRRSGTSILRKLIIQHPKVKNIEFEPNELFEITERIDIPRYKNISYFKNTILRFKNHSNYYGAKLAINPGIEGMRWKNFNKFFPDAKFIFIQRNPEKTYKSWLNIETSERGTCNYSMYLDWWIHLNTSFVQFAKENKDKAVVLQYVNVCENADKELKKVWDLLKIEDINGLNKLIKKPKYGF